MKETHWEKSRKAYVEYRAAKRELNYTNKAHNRTYFKLEKALEEYMEAQTKH